MKSRVSIDKWNLLWRGGAYPCVVPTSLYSALQENKVIGDPYFRLNAKELEAYSLEDCAFETKITVDSELLSRDYVNLCFDGLDTLCDVYINENKVAYTDNMHRAWIIDAKAYLTIGENTVRLYFHSPLIAMREMQKKRHLIGNSDSFEGFAHIRKAYYMMGWDWCPSLPDMGIWRRVYLLAFDVAKIDNVEILQKHCDDGSVLLTCNAELMGEGNTLELRGELCDESGRVCEISFDGLRGSAVVENPELWWPNGYGEQYLYTVNFSLYDGDTVIDTHSEKIGLRTIEVSTAYDEYGREFCVIVNGERIFAMGANYVPEDCLLSRYSYERTERLIKACKQQNFNMIRVWGGGVYPEDYFFELCDEYGIIVWQDFMFACTQIWLTEEFYENVKEEIAYNLKRIRNHASLGILCGNNECEEALCYWRRYSKDADAKKDYIELFERRIPKLCAQYAPNHFYWQSSPSSKGSFEYPKNPDFCDSHFWYVWLCGEPIEEYRKYYFRFLSEFGITSLTNESTLDGYMYEEDKDISSETSKFFHRRKNGNQMLMEYVLQNYKNPRNYSMTVYATQLVQAQAMRGAVEHLRRNRGRCMGALYWQLNDAWVGHSLSSICYDGAYKALHYEAKKFFAPILLSAHRNEKRIAFNVSNETRANFCGSAEFVLRDNDFNTLYSAQTNVAVDRLSARDVADIDFTEYVLSNEKYVFVEYSLYDLDNNLVFRGTERFVLPKDFEYRQPKFDFSVDNGYLCVSADCFAEKIFVDAGEGVSLEEQYFTVSSKNPIRIKIIDGSDIDTDKIRVRTIYDIGK